MRNQLISSRLVRHVVLAAVGLSIPLAAVAIRAAKAADQGADHAESIFNGKNLDGWKLREENEKPVWSVVSEVKLDPQDHNKLVGSGQGGSEEGILFRGPVEHGVDILTEKQFGDCEVHCEFMVPQDSNSGVYLMGEYEVQILSETSLKKDDQLNKGDCAAIYNTKAPSTQAETEPGTWQTYDIVFRAPRFDANGKKTENAKFISVVFNGKKVQENVEAPEPTGGQLGEERAKGPLLLQGDHGIVAFRNIRVKELPQN